jgi:dynein light chain LC8-type
MADKKLQVHFIDADNDLLVDAVNIASRAIDLKKPDFEIARELKREFDSRYNLAWHCIVGKHFGAYVSNEETGGLYFTYGQTSVLLFRAG